MIFNPIIMLSTFKFNAIGYLSSWKFWLWNPSSSCTWSQVLTWWNLVCDLVDYWGNILLWCVNLFLTRVLGLILVTHFLCLVHLDVTVSHVISHIFSVLHVVMMFTVTNTFASMDCSNFLWFWLIWSTWLVIFTYTLVPAQILGTFLGDQRNPQTLK